MAGSKMGAAVRGGQHRTGRPGVRVWVFPAVVCGTVLMIVHMLVSRGANPSAEMASPAPRPILRELDAFPGKDLAALRSSYMCEGPADGPMDPNLSRNATGWWSDGGREEQRICVFQDVVLHDQKVLYVSEDPKGISLPKIQYAWLSKFEGDDIANLEVVGPSDPRLAAAAAAPSVLEAPTAGLFHQQHYSNFYHMFAEVAPTIHAVLCRALGDCAYDPSSDLRLFFVQDKRPGMPEYVMLDSIVDVFHCLTPHPVRHKGDAELAERAVLLRRAVIGVGTDVRVFHNWEKDLKENWRELDRDSAKSWRARVGDCFGFDFQNRVVSKDGGVVQLTRAEVARAAKVAEEREAGRGSAVLAAAAVTVATQASPVAAKHVPSRALGPSERGAAAAAPASAISSATLAAAVKEAADAKASGALASGASLAPPVRILFINRHYEEGRMVLNAAKIAHEISKMPEAKAFPNGVEVVQHYLESDETIQYQAGLFWNASVLIWPHGATMSHTLFLPQGAQAIEIVPWVQEDKANLPEWVQAIRDVFGLRIQLFDVQNHERRRSLFNKDALETYEEYRRLSDPEKIALLERGECPAGVDGFLCPFWWNHWKLSVNMDWEQLRPVVAQALENIRSGWNKETEEAEQKGLPKSTGVDKRGAMEVDAAARLAEAGAGSKKGGDASEAPPQTSAAWAVPSAGKRSAGGVPLSSHKCVANDGDAATRLCLFSDLFVHEGALYYVVGSKADVAPTRVALPPIQVAWEDWTLEKDPADASGEAFLPGEKYLDVRVVSADALPFPAPADADRVIDRAALVHPVDSGNFYHLLSEVQPTIFSGLCGVLDACRRVDLETLRILFTNPDPKRKFGLPRATAEGFACLGQGPPTHIRDPEFSGRATRLRRASAGIGPYMRAYERQPFRAAWSDPPKGVMSDWRRVLAECTRTDFDKRLAPSAAAEASGAGDGPPVSVVFVNRPFSSGRGFLNLPETVAYLRREWAPTTSPLRRGTQPGQVAEPPPVRISVVEPDGYGSLRDQIETFADVDVLVYPHGATMTHAAWLPRGAAVLEIIPWPNVTEPHDWLRSVVRQEELDVETHLLVNERRANLVFDWHALSLDPVWRGLPDVDKVALVERGTCPVAHEPRCFFDWLHWKSMLVLDGGDLVGKLTPLVNGARKRAAASKARALLERQQLQHGAR